MTRRRPVPTIKPAAAAIAYEKRLEVIANNLANVNTAGFKTFRAHFEDLLYQTVQGQSVLGEADSQTSPAIKTAGAIWRRSLKRCVRM